MANKARVAATDGVMVKVGDRYVSLYKDVPVPEGADAEHLAVLEERGLIVDAPESDAPAEDHGDAEGADADKAEAKPARK